MGHYDSCYEAEYELKKEREKEETDKKFIKLQSKLKTHEKDFLLNIANNINDYMIFFKVLKKLK